MRLLCFELTMPGVASWNGRWSGEGRCYAKVRSITKEMEAQHLPTKGETKTFDYRWDDGWCALVTVRQVLAKEATRLRKNSVGFYGYDWMIDSILEHGKIIND